MTEKELTRILIVDDRVENLLALEGWLGDFDLNIVKATSGQEALERLMAEDFALVLLDVQMPGMDGFETAGLMRGADRTKRVPIIFVTAISKEEKNIFKGYDAGAVDFIFKPVEPHVLRSKVSVFVQLYQQKKQLQEKIDELQAANEKIRHLSILDSLTGCFNRGYLNDHLPTEIKRTLRYKSTMSLILTDIDHFKKINDTHGHQCGDKVLKAFADTLQIQIRKNVDWVSRYGGEEFVLVLPETGIADAITVAEKLREFVSKTPMLYKEQEINISASFGVAAVSSSDASPEETVVKLLNTADQRMYKAKKRGRNRVVGEE